VDQEPFFGRPITTPTAGQGWKRRFVRGGGPYVGRSPLVCPRAERRRGIYPKSDESFIEKPIFVVAAKKRGNEANWTSVRCRKALLDVTVHVRKAETGFSIIKL
jgi:hypothetical protein